jgi:hypothetical protein
VQVKSVIHLGDLLEIDAETSWGLPISARVPRGGQAAGWSPREGDQIEFNWRPEEALLFRAGS